MSRIKRKVENMRKIERGGACGDKRKGCMRKWHVDQYRDLILGMVWWYDMIFLTANIQENGVLWRSCL